MEGKIIGLMTEGERALHRGGEGRVHSVYRKTINLVVKDHLYGLQAKGSPLSPLSFLLNLSGEEMQALPVKAGDRCRFSLEGIALYPEGEEQGQVSSAFSSLVSPMSSSMPLSTATIFFSLAEGVTPVESSLLKNEKRLSPGEGESLLRQARELLFESGLPGFCTVLGLGEEEDFILLAAKKILEKAEGFFMEGKEAEGCEALLSLVGLGGGLTPSGDDLLCGFLAGLFYLGERGEKTLLQMQKLLPSYLDRTNDISRAFLELALRGEFSLPVHHFFMGQGNLSEFLAIGHSSGVDTLLGIFLSLRSHSGFQPSPHAPACTGQPGRYCGK